MNVAIVNMPFSAIRPAIGASLLKAAVQATSHDVRVIYLNMAFAHRCGPVDYEYVSERTPMQALAGDWVFTETLLGPDSERDLGYLDMLRNRFGYVMSEHDIEAICRTRALAEQFIDVSLSAADWGSFDLVGFTSTFTQHIASLALANRLKEAFPHVQIAFGGANCEDVMGLQLHQAFPFVDYVFTGEADITFPKLLDAIEQGSDEIPVIDGVVARVHGKSRHTTLVPERVRDLDQLPCPDYDDYFEQLDRTWPDLKRPRSVLMETSRGCWWGQKHHCTFCGLNGGSMTFRSKSAKRALEEVDELRRRYRPAHIEMVDNILDMKYFKDLLPELKLRQLALGLFYETKANLTKEQVRLLREAGVAAIQPGIESFSSDVLRLMRKGTTGIQNVQLLKWCQEYGLKTYWNLLYGFPGEAADDYAMTVTLIEDIIHLQPPHGVGSIRLDRFSPNFTESRALGITDIRPDRTYAMTYGLDRGALDNLAYYFEHAYADGRDPESYVGETKRAVRRWQERPETVQLSYFDHGDTLAIWDSRPCSQQRISVLQGFDRLLYLRCESYQSLDRLTAFAHDSGYSAKDLSGSLDELLDGRLLLRLDERFLSLAVARSDVASPRSLLPERIAA